MPKPQKILKGDGRKWTTLEQGTWLRNQIPSYLLAKSGGNRGLQVFWEKLFNGWFSQWPEAAAPSFLPPQADSTAAPAAAEEDADTMGITKLRLKQWYNNHARGVAAAVDSERRLKPLNLSVRPTRKLSATQAYGKLYSAKLKPVLKERWDQYIKENPGASGRKGEQLRHQNGLLKELLSAEPDEVKQRVDKCREEGIASDEEAAEPEGDGESTSSVEAQRRAKAYAFQRAQDRLKVTVESALAEIEKATGLVGFMVLGGPEPRCGGNMMVMSVHTGKNINGLDFSESYDGWKSTVEEPFLMHLSDIFSREDCIARALPRRVARNTAAPSIAESSRLPTGFTINAASSNHVAESERAGSYEPGNVKNSERANEESIAFAQNFIRDLQASGLSKAASVDNFQELSGEEDAGEQIELDGLEESDTEPVGQLSGVPLEGHSADPSIGPALNSTTIFEPNSDALLSCDDWPAWLADGVNYLQKISKEEKWVLLLVRFVELEQLLGSAKIKKNLGTKNRPSEIAAWLKYGRKYSSVPQIRDLSQYKLSWQRWWWELQPEWRQLPDRAVSMEVPDKGEQWEALRRGGPNGLFMAVLGLAWWAAALDNVSGNKELCGALDDAIWVIQHIVSSLKIGREGQGVKRAGDSSFDTVLAKRPCYKGGASIELGIQSCDPQRDFLSMD